MFDINYEKSKHISTEQMAMILDMAAQAASDGGFVSSYIFSRAAYVFAAQVLYPEKKDAIASSIGVGYDIRLAFDLLAQDGTLADMQTNYTKEMEEHLLKERDALLKKLNNEGDTFREEAQLSSGRGMA